MATKAEDPHVHEVVLEDGFVVVTGPPIEEPATEEPPAPVAPMTRRAKLAPEDELAQAKSALLARDANALPPAGLSVWGRMYDSAVKFSAGRHPENYPTAIAWYAVRQKYHLEAERGGPGYAQSQAQREGKAQGHRKEAQAQSTQAPEGFRRVQVVRALRGPARLASASMGPWSYGSKLILTEPARWQRHVKFILKPEKAIHRIAYGIAYMPWEVDLQGQYATEDQVLQMAHKFISRLATDNSQERTKIGEMHRRWEMPGRTSPGRVVESWVIGWDDDPTFPQGAWIVGVKSHPEVWAKIENGTYTGFSIGGKWRRRMLQMADEVYARMPVPERMAA